MSERRKSRPECIAAVLGRALAGTGLQRRLEERGLLAAWPKVVGERIARFSSPVDIEDGILTVQAANAVWRQELTLLLPEIMRRYNELCGAGTVREIRWSRWGPRRPRPDPRG